MACENNDFTPCLRAFSEFPCIFGGEKINQRENFVLPAACFLHDGGFVQPQTNPCAHGSVVRVNVLGRWYTPLGIFLALCLDNMQ